MKSSNGCRPSRAQATRQTTTGHGRCAQRRTGRLLRWLEDGPLVVVSDGSGARPKLKARLMATGQAGTFGESGERFSTTVEDTPADSRELLARVDFAPGTDAGMESMLGFRQDLGMAGSVQSVAAVSVQPEIEGAGDQGLDEAAVRSFETMQFGDAIGCRGGFDRGDRAAWQETLPSTATAMLPFANVAWHAWRQHITLPDGHDDAGSGLGGDDSETAIWLPAMAMRNGALAIEHGISPGDRLGAADRFFGLGRSGLLRSHRQSRSSRRWAALPQVVPLPDACRALRSRERPASRRGAGLFLHGRGGQRRSAEWPAATTCA